MNVRMLRSRFPKAALFAALFLLCACTTLTAMRPVRPQPQVTSLIDVPQEKAVVVGRIEFHPPLQQGEQRLNSRDGEELKNAFILYAGPELKDLAGKAPATFEGSYSVTLDREFFIRVDRGKTLFLSGGTFYTEYAPPSRVTSYPFSSPFRVDVKAGDEAVYIGTIQYYRDGNNKVKEVMIRDDYQWADTQFKERFGTAKTLRKALVTPVGPAN